MLRGAIIRGRDASPEGSPSFGIAFGAIGALLLGVTSLLSALAAATGSLPAGVLPASYGPVWVLFPTVERAAAVFVHVFSVVLIFYAVAGAQARWFWLSFATKRRSTPWRTPNLRIARSEATSDYRACTPMAAQRGPVGPERRTGPLRLSE